MCMRVKNRVQPLDTVMQRLIAKVRGGVDQHTPFTQLQENRWAKSLVTWIGRDAGFAVAADHRHAHARARSEHEYGRMLEIREHLFGLASFAAVRSDDKRTIVFLLGLVLVLSQNLRSTSLFLLLVDNLHVAETKFGEAVLDQALFRHG